MTAIAGWRWQPCCSTRPRWNTRFSKSSSRYPCDDPDAAALRVELNLVHGALMKPLRCSKDRRGEGPRLARLRGRARSCGAIAPRPSVTSGRRSSDLPSDRVAISELGKALCSPTTGRRPNRYMAQARRLDDVYNLINRVSRPDRENHRRDLTRLGKACEAAGLREEARGWYALAIAQEPLDARRQQGLRRLHDVGMCTGVENRRSSARGRNRSGSIAEIDSRAIAIERGECLERAANCAFLPESRVACATIRMFLPLTRTSTDRTRSPSVSRICFSILRFAGASPSGSERSAAFSFWRAAVLDALLTRPAARSPGVAGRTGRAFRGMAAAQGEDGWKPPVNLRMNRWIWACAGLEHRQGELGPVTRAAATKNGRGGRPARAAAHPRAARLSSESVGRADRPGCRSSVARARRRTASFPATGPRATARLRAVGNPPRRRGREALGTAGRDVSGGRELGVVTPGITSIGRT